MKDFTQDIVQKIKKGEIHQESRWRFLAHDYFLWFLTILSVVFGALAVSSILHKISMEQITPLRAHLAGPDSIPIFIQTLPYLWLGVFVVLLFAAWFNYKRISLSYRKHNAAIILGVVIVSLLAGFGLFAAGAGKHVDEGVRKHVPAFERQFENRKQLREQFLEKRRVRQEAEVGPGEQPVRPIRR